MSSDDLPVLLSWWTPKYWIMLGCCTAHIISHSCSNLATKLNGCCPAITKIAGWRIFAAQGRSSHCAWHTAPKAPLPITLSMKSSILVNPTFFSAFSGVAMAATGYLVAPSNSLLKSYLVQQRCLYTMEYIAWNIYVHNACYLPFIVSNNKLSYSQVT